jgi:hypothetical protein
MKLRPFERIHRAQDFRQRLQSMDAEGVPIDSLSSREPINTDLSQILEKRRPIFSEEVISLELNEICLDSQLFYNWFVRGCVQHIFRVTKTHGSLI